MKIIKEKKNIILIIQTILIVTLLIIYLYSLIPVKKLKNINKLNIPIRNTKSLYMPYTVYLNNNTKLMKEDIENGETPLEKLDYNGYQYSIINFGYSYYFIFYKENNEVEALINVPIEFMSLNSFVKEFNKDATWIQILKNDSTTDVYDYNETKISEHLLINGDILVIEYDWENNQKVVSYKIYPKLATKYLNIIKEILNEL